MANVITMPLLSDTMEEGIIADVFLKIGDAISGGEILAEVETDKATMEVEAYDEHQGELLYIAGKGDAVPVGGVLAITGTKGENIADLLVAKKNGASTEKEEESSTEELAKNIAATPTTVPEVKVEVKSDNGRVKASPLAKKMAADAGIALNAVNGSGDEGRIVKRDIEAALSGKAPVTPTADLPATSSPEFKPQPIVGQESTEKITHSQMRKTIAKRLAQSKFGAPHFYLTMELNMDNAIAARKELNAASPVKISFNDLIIKAAALALRKHPEVNSFWNNDYILRNNHVHIGMAVAVPDGLVVPVIQFADNLSLAHLAHQTKDLGNRAKAKKLSLDEMEGSTFSISNLGMMGIEEFTAIINPPNSAIMAVGGIKQEGRVVNGELKPVSVMKVTLSCDHRVIDGAVGATFLNTFKQFIENPITMLV